ncbi:MAG: DMT family transporter [Maritimibacter sp.]
MTQKSLSSLAWVLLCTLALIWGGSFLGTRTAMDELTPFHVVAHRVLWAALALWVVALVTRLSLPSRRDLLALAVMGFLNVALPFSLQAWAQLTIETGLAAIFNASTAVFAVLTAAVFLADERLSLRKAAGVGLGFLGVATAMGLAQITHFDPRSLAQLAMVASTLCYALSGVWARKTLAHLPPLTIALGGLSFATLFVVPFSWVMEGPLPFDLSVQGWFSVGYISLAATAGALLLFYRCLALAGAGNTGLVTLMVAPIAVVLGAVVRFEALPPRAYVGFLMLALGLIILDGRLLWRAKTPPTD